MSQSDDAKTKFLKSKGQGKADDATLIDSSRREAGPAAPSNDHDKTVIGDERRRQHAAWSRLARGDYQGDVTQFVSGQHDEATRVLSGDDASADDASADVQSSAQRPAQPSTHEGHLVLKERFVLERVLGAGGMGVVYKAKDLVKVKASDRDPYIAIKVLSEEFKAHPESFMALQRESRKTQSIAHPNIVTVYDFDEDGDTVFMTMEYMEGKPLDKLLKQYSVTGLPSDDIWEILKGMCAALVHAHGENIIHSDFKPGNVFVTTRGIAKVFDFGIARAVAQADQWVDSAGRDHTLFDAGNLGALTPAYASLEMLEGKEPDQRDDIYALGCVVYELFAGRHPFDKASALDAYGAKLKPKRIKGLSKRQWQALEKSLAFRREHRMPSVDAFLHEMTVKLQRSYMPAFAALVLAAAGGVYWQVYLAQPVEQDVPAIAVTVEDPNAADIEFHKDRITRLLDKASFTSAWQEDLWDQVQSLRALLPAQEPWLVDAQAQIVALYLVQIQAHKTAGRYSQATALLDNAYRYAADTVALDDERNAIAQLIHDAEQRRRQATVARQQEAQRRAQAAREAERQEAALLAKVQQQQQDAEQEQQRRESFDAALKNVEDQLACRDGLNLRNVETAVEKLRDLDMARYRTLEPGFIRAAVSCIQTIGQREAERAEELKRKALRLFDGHSAIAAITIVPRDACHVSIAGLGSRGERASCRDHIDGVGQGPRLVVVPAQRSGGIDAFAIGKYEVSVAEFNMFCSATGQCTRITVVDPELPATNVPFATASRYLDWLSQKTRRTYRLPSKNEWRYASQSVKLFEDPNRNCTLKTRSLNKGMGLIKVGTGQQNGWGLVNYVGNAQEWVYDAGRKLVAVGGSYSDHISECTIATTRRHGGTADEQTGFRVLREIQKSNL